MTDPIRPSGDYAQFMGRAFEARFSPGWPIALKWRGANPPAGFERSEQKDREEIHVRLVELDQLERLVRVRTLCTYSGGGPWQVMDLRDGIAYLIYVGEDNGWAAQQPGVYFDSLTYPLRHLEVPLDEISNVHEEVTDLLAQRDR